MIPLVALYESWIPFALVGEPGPGPPRHRGLPEPGRDLQPPGRRGPPLDLGRRPRARHLRGVPRRGRQLEGSGTAAGGRGQDGRPAGAPGQPRPAHRACRAARCSSTGWSRRCCWATARTGHTSVLMLDMDGFKEVNDVFGHGNGDLVLIEVARRLVDRVRPHDTVTRMGGDEYAVLLVGMDAEDAEETSRPAGRRARPALRPRRRPRRPRGQHRDRHRRTR